MLVHEYGLFVASTDLNKKKEKARREDIAIYGVVGEMGALASAVKRRLMAADLGLPWDLATDEVREELGDSLWYWAILTQIYDGGPEANLKRDIANLQHHLAAEDERGKLFRGALTERLSEFNAESTKFIDEPQPTLSQYQTLAFKTRRTEGEVLVGVCLTMLSQLGAELLRLNFPTVETQINTIIPKRDASTILGEIAWHLSAISSIYKINLGDIAEENQKKLRKRLDKSSPTPLHDERYPRHEHFPVRFNISFVMIGGGRSRMYLDGRRLGDELTDNAYEDDGYRFHDVLHLAVLANLSWSPVLRSLLKKKRKSNIRTDEVEDGARATIVEEAVIKAIHSEGERVSAPRKLLAEGAPVPLFAHHGEITFQFLRFIDNLTKGLEVERNQYWEWERAMLQASDVFCELRKEEQGTVAVDLVARSIAFRPEVFVDGPGVVAVMGSAQIDASRYAEAKRGKLTELEWVGDKDRFASATAVDIAENVATKDAILQALGLSRDLTSYSALRVTPFGEGVSVKATRRSDCSLSEAASPQNADRPNIVETYIFRPHEGRRSSVLRGCSLSCRSRQSGGLVGRLCGCWACTSQACRFHERGSARTRNHG